MLTTYFKSIKHKKTHTSSSGYINPEQDDIGGDAGDLDHPLPPDKGDPTMPGYGPLLVPLSFSPMVIIVRTD